ncbi:hypothetical protein ONE63_000669 [Megalurothrips usitatus]|uniref:Uncharacterized protein n=1 Tax=Megalurothrips usitatus TaxID=439358 RepID=A0AAV7Y569_9NEOP|nr:hypothetical protein ONE63_000669 [Megalurothrips usitatus]
MQPQLPLLLHVAVGEAEQPVPAVPAGVEYPADGEMKPIHLVSCNFHGVDSVEINFFEHSARRYFSSI